MAIYDSAFFREIRHGSSVSAQAVVPIILEYIQPQSIVDVGCGTGTWLNIFKSHGITDVLGIDGDYIGADLLEIDPNEFRTTDIAKPIKIGRKFGLVVCLKVAEHLPETSAATFIESLTGLGPAVLFSAAIPLQGGLNHVNEQWPTYWRDIFKIFGYVGIDCIRGNIWDNEKVAFWYAQNIVIYVREEELDLYPALKNAYEACRSAP